MLKSVGSDLSRYTKGGKSLDIVAGFKGAVDFKIFIHGKDRLTEQGKRKKQTGQHVQHFFFIMDSSFYLQKRKLV